MWRCRRLQARPACECTGQPGPSPREGAPRGRPGGRGRQRWTARRPVAPRAPRPRQRPRQLHQAAGGATENDKEGWPWPTWSARRPALQQAQSAYDQVASLPNVGLLPQLLNLQRATIDYEQAKRNTRLPPPAWTRRSVRRRGLLAAAAGRAARPVHARRSRQASSPPPKSQEGATPEQTAASQAQVTGRARRRRRRT